MQPCPWEHKLVVLWLGLKFAKWRQENWNIFFIDISVEKTKSHIRCGCRKDTSPLVEGTHECGLLLVVFRTQ